MRENSEDNYEFSIADTTAPQNGRDPVNPKFPTDPTGKNGPPEKVDQFYRNFSGWTELRSIEFCTEISGNFG